MSKSLFDALKKEKVVESAKNETLTSIFNLSFLYRYGRENGIISIKHYITFYNKINNKRRHKMSAKDKKEFFATLTKIMVAIERVKITEGIV